MKNAISRGNPLLNIAVSTPCVRVSSQCILITYVPWPAPSLPYILGCTLAQLSQHCVIVLPHLEILLLSGCAADSYTLSMHLSSCFVHSWQRHVVKSVVDWYCYVIAHNQFTYMQLSPTRLNSFIMKNWQCLIKCYKVKMSGSAHFSQLSHRACTNWHEFLCQVQ